MEKERGIICMFCGEGFGYAGEKPDDETMKDAIDHEKVCPKNPYLEEITELRAELEREKEKFRIAAICISEYQLWLLNVEQENERLRRGLYP